MFTNFPESRQDRLDSLGSERGKNNKGRMLLVHLRRSGSSPRAKQRTRMRDSRMSEGEKEGPARQRRTAHPRVVTGRPDRARGMRGLALTVPSINYMDNSLGKVKKAHRTRAVIMHSNSQLTDSFVSLALRRAAHDCITGDGSSGAALRLY